MLKNVFYPSRQRSTSETGKCRGNDSDLACWFEFLKFAEMFADPTRIANLVKWHEWRLLTDSFSESDMLDVEPDEPAKRLKVRGYAWSFERECECEQLFHDARQMADFILDVDIKKPMPASLGITYLVVMFLVDISITTG